MAFRIFTIPISQTEPAEAEMNAFLRSHRVLSVDRRWVDQGPASFWTFCVDYLDSPAASGKNRFGAGGQRAQIDYKDQLSAEDFAQFARLRDFRKALGQAEAVPV